ncbi:hypothetical protein FANTH_6828 [Fusarium anthophilum]|uniref:Transcription factor domain-containing protein n=1 Tax=Fusarium anthophilum TaxID=48485 RepID=A0A8H5E4Q0_9HYPO|nr:hypothetical protein FANTH_6828 [Fusarium anthophilum]
MDDTSPIQVPSTGNPRSRPSADLPTAAQSESPAPSRSPETTEVTSGTERSGQLALGLGVLSSCAGAEPHYFGFSAGLSLAHFVQVAIDSGENPVDVSLPQLADRPFSHQVPKDNITLAEPPKYNAGASYIRAYLALVHPLYPFLNVERLWQLHRSITKRRGGQESACTEQIDLTMMHLVYAIGSRCLQLLQKSSISSTVSEGHFLRAMEHIRQDLKFTSTKSIEVTLLLAIHSMRSPYGRPFALSDEEIDLPLPADMDDGNHATTPDEIQQHILEHRSHEIRLALSRMKKSPSKEGLRMTTSKLLQQLDQWKKQVLTTFREDASEGPDDSTRLTDYFREQDNGDSEESSSSETSQHQVLLKRPVEMEKNELLLEYHKARRQQTTRHAPSHLGKYADFTGASIVSRRFHSH